MRSQRNSLCIILLGLVSLVASISADGELFKINKLNLIWSKAQHSLGATKLKDLKNDLVKHELDELALKQMRAHNRDKDGLFEAATRKKLLSILTKYSLEKYYDDIHPPISKELSSERNKPDVDKSDKSSLNLKPTFRDKKLDKLWRKAEQSGFTQEQLMILHEEFEHQQDKLEEHYETMNNLEQEIERKAKQSKMSENSLEEEVRETPEEKKLRLQANVHQSLKDKYIDIKKNYDKLHKKIVEHLDGPFEEEIVNKLWSAARETNFSEKELESLKDELSHFEVRIKKLKHFENQLERNSLGSKDSHSSSDDDELKHIHKRVLELNQKVEKSQRALEKKISDKRDEL